MVKNIIKQYQVFLINLDPTVGFEIKKTRPCVVISPNEMNENLNTIIIAPLTTKSHPFPTRIPLHFGKKNGWIVLDQIRTIDKNRIVKNLGEVNFQTIKAIKAVLQEMLID